MKKTLLSLSIIATMVASLFNLSSCGNDDSTPTPARTISDVLFWMTILPTSFMNDSLNVFARVFKSNNDTLGYIFSAEKTKIGFKVPASEFPVDLYFKYCWTPTDDVNLGDEFVWICRKFVVSTQYVMSDGTTERGAVISAGHFDSPTFSTGTLLMKHLIDNKAVINTTKVSIDKEGNTYIPENK